MCLLIFSPLKKSNRDIYRTAIEMVFDLKMHLGDKIFLPTKSCEIMPPHIHRGNLNNEKSCYEKNPFFTGYFSNVLSKR